jgi:hypothetical protein
LLYRLTERVSQGVADDRLRALLLLCFLTGTRLGEAIALLRGDIVTKGNLGAFVKVQPNRLRKPSAAESEAPLHSTLVCVLDGLPRSGPLFLGVSINMMTNAFVKLRDVGDGGHLVFHGTRKWFITQCERRRFRNTTPRCWSVIRRPGPVTGSPTRSFRLGFRVIRSAGSWIRLGCRWRRHDWRRWPAKRTHCLRPSRSAIVPFFLKVRLFNLLRIDNPNNSNCVR